MSNPFDSAANVMLEELVKRRQEIQVELERIDGAIRALAGFRPKGLADVTQGSLPGLDLRDLTYAEAAERILERANRQPLATKILLRRMEIGGRKVRGSDPYRILYRTLMKNDRFKSVAGRWALAEWYPPSGQGSVAEPNTDEEEEKI